MPKKTFRFLVENEVGKSSTVWSISVSKEDIYVTPRIMGKSAKVSLHKSGQFNWSLRQEYINSGEKLINGSRHIAKWNMNHDIEGRMNHIFRISIPSSELRSDNKSTDKSCLKIKAPEIGKATIIDLYISPKIQEQFTHLDVINESGGKIIFIHAMEHRKVFICTHKTVIMSHKDLAQLEATKLFSKKISKGINTYGVARMTNETAGISGMLEFFPDPT